MYCYVCSEPIRDAENYCRGCGTPTATSHLKEHNWFATFGHFATGLLCFGLFTILVLILSVGLIKLAPIAVFFILALAGGIALGFAIHLYSNRRLTIMNPDSRLRVDRENKPDLLPEPSAISFMTMPDSVTIPTTSRLTVPNRK